jgi:RNA ligase (TIGR02306 family)
MTRKLVSVRRVESVHPIEGADAIERARVDGWDVVVKKEENYQPGDLTIFFEIDAALPLDGFFGFLANRSPKRNVEWRGHSRTCHVIRTAKLRGVVSQGLMVLPNDLFGGGFGGDELGWLEEGLDLTDHMEEHFGVTKWEAVLPPESGGGIPKGNFPTHLVRKTDSERVQNLGSQWDKIQTHVGSFHATEKIDGTSSTFIRTEDELIVCSRNWMIQDGPNVYWNIAHRYSLFDVMPVGAVLQGEIYGEGVQKNRLGIKGIDLAVFNVQFGDAHDAAVEPLAAQFAGGEIDIAEYLLEAVKATNGHDGWYTDLPKVGIYTDLKLPATIDETIAQANGIRSLISPDRLAEGIVWAGMNHDFLSGRNNFKAISNKYLLKEKD